MLWNKDKLFCEINPTCYAISMQKEIIKRHVQDLFDKETIAASIRSQELPTVISSHSSNLIKKGPGIDPVLQKNKADNIALSCSKIDKMIIRPNEVFSFWKTVGKITKKSGYKDGRVIEKNVIQPGIGGGLCNLANTIHLLILHSPLDVIEFHSHSDALAPDHGERIPFSSGTSISYNNCDYRFKNNTNQSFQLLLWCADEKLYGQLRSEKEIPQSYRLIEEDHHFKKENDKYYRISKIYKEVTDRLSGKVLDKTLVLDNHSEVMFDYALIPEEQIRN